MTLRTALLAQAEWGVVHTAAIHYAEVRPIPLHDYKAHKLPITTDCSGFVTACAFAAGAPDPNGQGYNGQGFTGTLLQHLPHITKAEALPGDFVVFGPFPGEHVVMLVDKDGACISHGQEAGPLRTTVAVEAAGHTAPTTYLRSVPVVSTAHVWDVRDGRNEHLATTKHPALWGMRHPRAYRRHGIVSYHRRNV